jgi:REP element-mobilizing transposase RayT
MFRDDGDRRDLLRRLSDILPESSCQCLAWVLMPNHIHLVVRTGPVPLGRVMARVGTGYAMHFNRRYDRVGHLIQNRFRSRLVTDDADLLNLIRYVHLNPVRAHIVDSLSALRCFPWSGHAALIGDSPQAFHSCVEALALFGDDLATARLRLIRFMRSGMKEAPQSAVESPIDRLRALVREVCNSYGIDTEGLGRGHRDRVTSRARTVIAFRAATELGLTHAAIARAVGVSSSAVSRCLQRVRDFNRSE